VDLTADDLVTRIRKLRVNRSPGQPALYQSIMLLWVIGRAYRRELRIVE
jgi:hypothetical protein